MDRDSNNARMIRLMVENLTALAEEFDENGKTNCRDLVQDVTERVGSLHALPDPGDEDAEDIDYGGED